MRLRMTIRLRAGDPGNRWPQSCTSQPAMVCFRPTRSGRRRQARSTDHRCRSRASITTRRRAPSFRKRVSSVLSPTPSTRAARGGPSATVPCRSFSSQPCSASHLVCGTGDRGSLARWHSRHRLPVAPGTLLTRIVAAGKVDGLAAGLYHFDAASHDLTLVKPGVTRADLVRYSAGQDYFGDAAVMVFMTAMFGRTMWRYASPRAYRTVHIELGHLGQTFCLLATALGLAPFTTMALSEAAIERDLSLDGVNESAMCIVGAGRLP